MKKKQPLLLSVQKAATEVPTVRVGRRRLVDPDDLRAYIAREKGGERQK